jgi:hypothetical protein
LPVARTITTATLEGDRARLCWTSDGGPQAADACLWLGRDGQTSAAPAATPAFPRVRVLAAGGEEPQEAGSIVEVCLGATMPCQRFAPRGGKHALRLAAIDAAGERVAVIVQENLLATGEVVILDAASGAELARQTLSADAHGMAYWTRWLGAARLLVVETRRGTSLASGSLWQLRGKKLHRLGQLGEQVDDVVAVGDALHVVGGKPSLAVFDLGSGKKTGTVDLPGLVRGVVEAQALEPGNMLLAADHGTIIVALASPVAARVAFVPTGEAAPPPVVVEVPRCPAAP